MKIPWAIISLYSVEGAVSTLRACYEVISPSSTSPWIALGLAGEGVAAGKGMAAGEEVAV